MTPTHVAAFAFALLAPAAAAACPACATRAGAGLGTYAVVAAMIGVPYAITAVAIKVIRRLDREPGA